MRKFSSYGPVDTDLHYYAPRKALFDQTLTHLLGENPAKGGHYITVWAPRQTGKTWLMQQVLLRLQTDEPYQGFTVAKINLQHLAGEQDIGEIVKSITTRLAEALGKSLPEPDTLKDFESIFHHNTLDKPLILILDEFDALTEEAIAGLANVFRNIYISRQDQLTKTTAAKDYLLHSVALIGIRAVLGVENVSGSPFNVQRSLHIPNLTFAEIEGMFKWYEQESGQRVEPAVIERLFYETQGQPGLTCWFGELLTETYNQTAGKPITPDNFAEVYAAALNVLPNNHILNIISKAKQEPYKQFVLEMFKMDEKIPFRYDDSRISFLYLNGVVDWEKESKTEHYLKFACPFAQKRLFNYFAYELFPEMGQLHDPFDRLEDTITEDSLNIKNLMRRYEGYLRQNRDWLFKDAPRKTNLRLYEAVYHFNLYMYLVRFLQRRGGQVYPEFPTGNGKVDLIIKYAGQTYGLELKSYTDTFDYQSALKQAARYGRQLHLSEISLLFFVEVIDEASRKKYELPYVDAEMGITVVPIFIGTSA